MRGDLSETPAADACRQLAGDGATGTLAIAGPDGPGAIVFVDGQVVGSTSPTPHARLGDRLVGAGFLEPDELEEALSAQRVGDAHTRLGALLVERDLVPGDAVRLFVQEQILDALFEVVGWRFGAFEFRDGAPTLVPEVPFVMAVDEALVEVSRRQQEWHELSQVIPDLEAVPAFGAQQATASAPLEPDEFAVLASVDGERSVRALASDLGYGEFELARIVYGLVLLGVVEIRLPQDEIGAALDDALSPPSGGLRAVPAPDEDVTPDEAPRPGEEPEPAEPLVADAEPAEPLVGEPAPLEPVEEPAFWDEPEVWEPSEEDPIDAPAATAASEPDEPPTRPAPSDVPATSMSDVLRELRGLDAASATEPARHQDGASSSTPASTTPSDDVGQARDEATRSTGAADDDAPGDPVPDEERPARRPGAGDADVSEFLRELSRLSVDDTPDKPPRPKRPATPTDRDDPDDGKRKKRGLFGWGH